MSASHPRKPIRTTKLQYRVAALGADGKPLPHFPAWEQPTHPFAHKDARGTNLLATARVLLQRAEEWKERGGAKRRLAALESMEKIRALDRPIPPLRLPDDTAAVTVQAIGGIPDSGMVWGKWEIIRQPVRELTLSLPEDWAPNPELVAWGKEVAELYGVGSAPWEKLPDYALQPWRLDLHWPHPDWHFDWAWEAKDGQKTGKLVPSCLYLRWREIGPFPEDCIECDLFSIALSTHWLSQHREVERLPENVVVHIVGCNLEYVSATLTKSQRVGQARR